MQVVRRWWWIGTGAAVALLLCARGAVGAGDQARRDAASLAHLVHQVAGAETDADSDTGAADVHGESGAIAWPTAQQVASMDEAACMAFLRKHGVDAVPPKAPAPFVTFPVVLHNAPYGVAVEPRWDKGPHSRVLDCRLAVALTAWCFELAQRGVVRVAYYSIYRPVRPPQGCNPSKRRCAEAHRRWNAARSGRFSSRHNQALAIDVRWFYFADGTVVDVERDFPRAPGRDPCRSAAADDAAASFLRWAACRVHARRLFNVVLTPNANRAHHNHFHIDITPGAGWYIIR